MSVGSLNLDLDGLAPGGRYHGPLGAGADMASGMVPGAEESPRVSRLRPVRPARRQGPVECPASAPKPGYRMGRWERLGLTTVIGAAVVVILAGMFGPAHDGARSVPVRPGDTMLSVALRELPEVDPARAAEMIESASGLNGDALREGMTLQVPVLR